MVDETYTEMYIDTENDKEGYTIAGRDVILLNAPEVLLSPDTPLLTDAQDVAGAINELFSEGGGGGDEEDWQPPDDWLPVPEPEAYDIYVLINVISGTRNYLRINFVNPYHNYTYSGCGNITVDWGDGNIETYTGYECDDEGQPIGGNPWGAAEHTYSNTGQFVVHVITDKFNCYVTYIEYKNTNADILIWKSGEEIQYVANDGYFYYTGGIRLGSKIQYFRHLGNNTISKNFFMGCYVLKKVEFKIPLTVVPEYCFNNCYSLQNVNFSQVTEIGNYAFQMGSFKLKKMSFPKCVKVGMGAFQSCYGLASIEMPVCENIGDSAFSGCYTLEKANFPENCYFGTNCFTYCYNLDPHPDGSAN